MNLDITGFDWEKRRTNVEKFFADTDKSFTRDFLMNNQISYLYLVGDQIYSIDGLDLQIDNIFNNGQVRIYKVRK